MAEDIELAHSLAEGVVARVRAHASRRPEAIAVEDGPSRVTYGELWARAGRLALALRARGFGREDVVALRLGRSAEHVVAMLGVWRAGAAFLPLDPAAPRAREQAVLRDARAALVLSDRAALEEQARGAGGAGGFAVGVERDPSPEDLAYVIATSGSTGRPKLVEILHRGLVPMLAAQIDAFRVEPAARVAWMLSPAFDASISDIGTALVAGATLVVVPSFGGARVEDVLDALAVSHVDLPPSLLPLLGRKPASLRTIVIGGEVCAPEAVRAWADRVRVVNVYGPTEATVCTSLGVCGSTWDAPRLGAPLAHVSYEVRAGELWISGPGLARGYRGDAAATEARFVVERGARWYRTGDRVRPLPDGELAFAGRVDRQLKVRGRLVAPEEIEAALLVHPEVARAAVGVDGAGALVAFVVARAPSAPPSASTLREHLATSLSAWMIPSEIAIRAALPETASGKVDIGTLLRPRAERACVRAPNEPLEDALARLWSEVLDRPVAPDDDVRALGVDSLATLRLVVAAEAEGLALAPPEVAGAATARALAAACAARSARHRAAAAGARSAAELRADVARVLGEMPASSGAAPSARAARPVHILLTGATGMLGQRLLAELLARTDARVTALARTPAAVTGESARVRVVRGDLEAPRLGLSASTWDALADAVDTIVHCAARVNLVLPYEALREANLTGTARVLELARAGRAKTLHHVSTLSVFVATDRDAGVAREDDDLSETCEVHGGYAQSKWAAEHLARRAAPGRLAVHRLGLVTGARGDFLAMFFRGVAALGCVPDDADLELRVDVTPCPYAAAAVASLVADGATGTFHLASDAPPSLGDLLVAMRAEGLVVEPVPERVFRARAAARGEEAAAASLALCRGTPGFSRHRTMDLFQASGIRFDDARARAALDPVGLARPAVTADLLRRYVREAL